MVRYEDSYLPVDHDFEEMVAKILIERKSGKVYFFDAKKELDGVEGPLDRIEKNNEGKFLLVRGLPVRLDKIITIAGKPGPAYEEYDNYANACLACEDRGQF